MGFHNTSDNPALYRDDQDVADTAGRDPVSRLVACATAAGVMLPEEVEAVPSSAAAEVDAARGGLSFPRPGREAMCRHSPRSRTSRLRGDRLPGLRRLGPAG